MPDRIKGLRGIAEEIVVTRTGRATAECNAILDQFGTREKGHTRAARFLREQHGVSDWWAHAVVIRYKYAKGLRK